MPTPAHFDPDAAAQPGTGVFGLPHSLEQASIVLIPMPFDATTSYGGGASGGPEAIRTASAQVDLYDLQFGRVYEAGIFMHPHDEAILERSIEARRLAAPIVEKGGADVSDAKDADAIRRINQAGEFINKIVYERFKRVLDSGKVPGLVGGDHSTPFGAIRACAEKAGAEGLGILHVDAHMDLRDAFEGFEWSHASIMFNVLKHLPGVRRIVQVGIRDFGEGELNVAKHSSSPAAPSAPHTTDSWVVSPAGGARVLPFFDLDLARRQLRGEPWEKLCEEMINALPRLVYVSFDIDSLDPALCPHTGTPVPGGLSFNHAAILLEALARSGRKIVGFDLNEVSPAPDGEDEWDANVGARILYKICGAAAMSRRGR